MMHSEIVCDHVVAACGEAFNLKCQHGDGEDFIERNRSTRRIAMFLENQHLFDEIILRC